mgnify:CR=1 FL=1
MPPTNDERTRSTGPASSACTSRVRSSSNTRADLEPREVRAEADVLADAEADVVVRTGGRSRNDVAVGEDLLVAVRRRIEQAQRSGPARIVWPRSARSAVAVRQNWITGVVQRTISSTAGSTSAAFACSRFHSPGFSMNASMPPVIALRVVSLPATTSRNRYESSSTGGSARAVDAAVRDLAHDVVAGCRARRRSADLVEVGEHLEARAARASPACRRRAGTRDPRAR